MRILIVEDDQQLGQGLKIGLDQDGYTTDWVTTADDAAHSLRTDHFNLLILDLGLPGRGGLDLLRDLRQAGNRIPVLILTARDAVDDKVGALDAGADDYVVKPFDLEELGARMRALVRRSRGQSAPVVHAGDLALNTSRRQATVARRPVGLSPKEYALLELLMSHADQVVTRARLHATAYGWRDDIESNALEVHVHNLRRKLGKQRILTVRGIGYHLVSNPQT